MNEQLIMQNMQKWVLQEIPRKEFWEADHHIVQWSSNAQGTPVLLTRENSRARFIPILPRMGHVNRPTKNSQARPNALNIEAQS